MYYALLNIFWIVFIFTTFLFFLKLLYQKWKKYIHHFYTVFCVFLCLPYQIVLDFFKLTCCYILLVSVLSFFSILLFLFLFFGHTAAWRNSRSRDQTWTTVATEAITVTMRSHSFIVTAFNSVMWGSKLTSPRFWPFSLVKKQLSWFSPHQV